MLQYFINNRYKPTFVRGYEPKLEYFCKVDEDSSTMPRALHMHKNLVEILLVYEGTGIYTIDQNKYIAKKGDLIFYNSGVVHDEFCGQGTSKLSTYCLAISNLQLPNLERNKIISDKYSPIVNSDEYFDELLHLCEFIKYNFDIKDTKIDEFSNYLARAFVVKASTIIAQNAILKQIREDSLATKIKKYIDVNYSENISLNSIAKAVNANKFYLSHMFKSETGFSPMQYVVRRRIGEAQNLLINTDMNITHIAASVGYNNSNYFQNAFRDNVGLTPGEYRKKWKL